MKSLARNSKREGRRLGDAHRTDRTAAARERAAEPSLEVSEVVRYGTGRGSRVDLTVTYGDESVRLTGIPSNRVLSYGRIEKLAVEEGVVLPYFHYADAVWREALKPAMKLAREEPSLEGERIAAAIAAEIRAVLAEAGRGERASDFMAGKVVERGEALLMSPTHLVLAVRSRLVDDVLPQATIAEAAATHLGMREGRPRFENGFRPVAWAFPPSALAFRERVEAEDEERDLRDVEGVHPGSRPWTEPLSMHPLEASGDARRIAWTAKNGTDRRIPSMDGGSSSGSPAAPEGCTVDRVDGEKTPLTPGAGRNGSPTELEASEEREAAEEREASEPKASQPMQTAPDRNALLEDAGHPLTEKARLPNRRRSGSSGGSNE